MATESAPPRLVPIALLALLASGTALDAVGQAPWLLVATVIASMTVLIAQRTSWPFASAGAVIIVLAGYAIIARLYPLIPVALADKNRAVLLIAGLVVLVMIWRRRDSLRLPRRGAVAVASVVVVPIVIVAGALIAVIAVSDGVRASWAMHNDAVWNTMTARFVWEDGGIDPSAHPNSSPLTAALLAAAFAGGRHGLAAGELLQHDIGREAELWVFMAAASAILAGVIALRSLHGVRVRFRIPAALGVAAIPVTWFVLGHAMQFGFYNATISVVLLLAVWLVWLETRVAPLFGCSVLALSCVALLATWAPLAAIPAGLAAIALVSRDSQWWKQLRGLRLVAVLFAVLVVPVYILVVTLPDLIRDGAALGAEGGIFPIAPIHVVLIVAVTLAISTIGAISRGHRHELLGVVVVVAMGAIALTYLVIQRRDLDSLWGYYPAKMGWLLAVFLIVICAVSLLGWLEVVRTSAWASIGVGASSVLVIGALLMQVPPDKTTVAPLVSMVASTGLSQPDETTRLLFLLSNPEEKNLVVHYDSNPGLDGFVNGWLLQQSAESGEDPLRAYSYGLDGLDLARVCDAVTLWGGDTSIHTTDPHLETELAGFCDLPESRVVLHE